MTPTPLKIVKSLKPVLSSLYSPLPSPDGASVHDANARTPQVPFPNGRELRLAVIGATGCGKTAFIKKSMKRRGLTSSRSYTVELNEKNNINRFIHYSDRNAYLSVVLATPSGMMQTFYNATLIEINVAELINQSDEKPTGRGWPSCLPHVHGVFLCYDVSDRASFTYIVDLLSCFHNLRIPSMVLALKSDLQKHITPHEACFCIQRYAGLVELSGQTDKGKAKMRRCIGAFIKMIETKTHSVGKGYHNPALPDSPPLSAPLSTTPRSAPPQFQVTQDTKFDEEDDSEDDRPVDLRGLSFTESGDPFAADPYTNCRTR